MYYFRFRNFQIYKDALYFRQKIRNLIREHFPPEERFLLSDQLIRAMNSVILNIAEGSDRNTDKDFASFLNKSHTSLNEVVSCLDIALIDKYINNQTHKQHVEKARKLVEQITAFRLKLLKDNHKR